MNKLKLVIAVFLPIAAILLCGVFGLVFYWNKWKVYEPLNEIRTVRNSKDKQTIRLKDPFGIVVSADEIIYVTDGDTGTIWSIDAEGNAKVFVENLETPSGVAISKDGNLVVADSGDHTIKKVDVKSKTVSVIAGIKGKSGLADGKASETLFNAPVGITIGKDGTIFVADTYNDRIRSIDNQGHVKTIAGGDSPDYIDSADGLTARFDTPSGIAVLNDNSLIVADTGNNVLRKIDVNGVITTFAKDTQTNEQTPTQFYEPIGIVVADESTFYVTDTGNAAIKVCKTQPTEVCSVYSGNEGRGLGDGSLSKAKFNRPSNIAISSDGKLFITDTGNGLLRAVVGKRREFGSVLTTDEIIGLRPKPEEFRTAAPARWPYQPPERTREIAATFGEIRGEMQSPDGQAYFHNGLDIPGLMGEEVRAVRTEKSLLIFPVNLFATKRENMRLPTMGYVHINVGRDMKNKILNESKFLFRYDKEKKLSGIRIRRGTKFNAGESLGTLNNMYHVHLIAGTTGAEMNALAALELPGIKDTVAPTIQENGVTFFDKNWNEITQQTKSEKKAALRISQSTLIRIVVKAYDQMDGNAARRKLGAYKLGYQILREDGSHIDNYNEPIMTISFERLPDFSMSNLVYAKGSRAEATGETTLAYIVTNKVEAGEAKESFWDTSQLDKGNYIVRVFVEDFFGNRTTRDVKVHLVNANQG